LNKQIEVLGTIAVWRSRPLSESGIFFDGGGCCFALACRIFWHFCRRRLRRCCRISMCYCCAAVCLSFAVYVAHFVCLSLLLSLCLQS